MAGHINELGRMKCVDGRGRTVKCPPRLGCGSGGCMSGDKLLPFDLPVVGGPADLDVTDALLLGVLGGNTLIRVTSAIVRYLGGAEGMKYEGWFNLAVGGFSLIGLASERLRDSSAFLGFAITQVAQMTEPVPNFIAFNALKGVEKVTGWTLLAPPADGSAAGMRGLGQEGQGYRVRPQLQRPSDLISIGSRKARASGIGTSMLGATQMRRHQTERMRG